MQLYVSGMENLLLSPPHLDSIFIFVYIRRIFARRQWYGLPCYVEKEKVSEMGKRGARARKGRFEGSGETDASFEKSGKGTCIFIIRLYRYSIHDHVVRYFEYRIFIFFLFFFFSLYVLTELVYFYYGMHDELLYDSLQVCCTSFVFSIVFVKCRITARYATWMVSFNIENIALIKK